MMLQHELDFETAMRTRLKWRRLQGQSLQVFRLMSDGETRTLAELRKLTGYSDSAISARLRDFRKAEFGAHTLILELAGLRGARWYKYRLVVNEGRTRFTKGGGIEVLSGGVR